MGGEPPYPPPPQPFPTFGEWRWAVDEEFSLDLDSVGRPPPAGLKVGHFGLKNDTRWKMRTGPNYRI